MRRLLRVLRPRRLPHLDWCGNPPLWTTPTWEPAVRGGLR